MSSLSAVLSRIGDELLRLEFSPRGRAWKFGLADDGDGFEDKGDAGFAALDLWSGSVVVDEREGLGLSFQEGSVGLTVRAVRQPDGSGICFVEMSDRDIYRFFRTKTELRLRQILALCAESCDATVSFGGFELEWAGYTDTSVLDALQHGPLEYKGNPPPFGLLRKSVFPDTDVQQRFGGTFDVHAVGPYWWLERKNAAAIFAALQR